MVKKTHLYPKRDTPRRHGSRLSDKTGLLYTFIVHEQDKLSTWSAKVSITESMRLAMGDSSPVKDGCSSQKLPLYAILRSSRPSRCSWSFYCVPVASLLVSSASATATDKSSIFWFNLVRSSRKSKVCCEIATAINCFKPIIISSFMWVSMALRPSRSNGTISALS